MVIYIWTPSRRVLASPAESTTESTGPNSTATTVTTTGTRIVTTDGVHWDELPLPEGIHPSIVNISSDSWLVTGRNRDQPPDSPPFASARRSPLRVASCCTSSVHPNWTPGTC